MNFRVLSCVERFTVHSYKFQVVVSNMMRIVHLYGLDTGTPNDLTMARESGALEKRCYDANGNVIDVWFADAAYESLDG